MLDTQDLIDGRLSPAQQARYWDQGFLHPMQAVSAQQAASWRAEFEAMERDWLTADLPLPLNSYKRMNANVVMPLAAEMGRHPAILDVVEGVLGPDIMLFGVEFFIKEPNTTHVVTMHQDLTYWGLGEIDGLVTAWLALSPATSASGCMDMVAGSHKNPILAHKDSDDANNLLSRGQEVAVDVAPEDLTAVELQPGQMSLHHGLMIHGSGPNTSQDRRIAAVLRYLRPDMAKQIGGKDYARLVRGEDRHNNFHPVPEPDSLFAPEALALHDDIRRLQASVMMRGAASQGYFAKEGDA